MPFDTKPNTCSLGARITRTVPIQWSLSSGKCRDGADKSEMVTMYMLSCLRCGKFKNCVDKSGKLQQLKLVTPSVGAKRSADNGSGNIMYSSPS